MIVYYNKVGAMDKVDQHLAAYSTPIKKKNKINIIIISSIYWISLLNCYNLYYKSVGSWSPKNFKMKFVEKLIEENHFYECHIWKTQL